MKDAPDSQEIHDGLARSASVYGLEIVRLTGARHLIIQTQQGERSAIDFATNSPLGLNERAEVRDGAIEAIRKYGALHASIATARANTALSSAIAQRLVQMKGGDSLARVYPTTLSANIAVAAGLSQLDCTVVVHPNAHATVQLALKAALPAERVIRTGNTVEVALAFAKTTRRPVAIVEDGLYSMGHFADFAALRRFLDNVPNGLVWLDDAHSVGMRGKAGRGDAMEQLASYAQSVVVTGSFGKAFGAAGGFMVGPRLFVEAALKSSVADRFSCNLDIAGLGAVAAALDLLAVPEELERLQNRLAERLERLDAGLSAAGLETPQARSPIAFRVVPFKGPIQAIRAAGELLQNDGFLTTPVYFPTIARNAGAIRLSVSAAHEIADVDALVAALIRLHQAQ